MFVLVQGILELPHQKCFNNSDCELPWEAIFGLRKHST